MIVTYPYTKIIGQENIEFGDPMIIDDFVFIHAQKKMQFGNYTHIACFSSITGRESVTMGDYSGVSQGCRLLTSTDDFTDWGFGNSTLPISLRHLRSAPIIIKKFAIIGANSVILPGVTIGEGVSVGANSVVTKDLLPWGVYLGNKRFKERNRAGVMDNYQRFLRKISHA